MKLICLLVAGFLSAKVFELGGVSHKIVGGEEVAPKFKYPWMVSLRYKIWHVCGGILYKDNLVISAAHCVIGPIETWTADVHRHNLSKEAKAEDGFEYGIRERTMHPEYLTNDDNGNDVSVWILDTESNSPTGVIFDSENISDDDNKMLKVVGWGTVSKGGKNSDVLLEIELPVFNKNACKGIYAKLDTRSQFCAGFLDGGKDSCQADSGGPIFEMKNGIPVLVGIVSWGEGCAKKGFPGVYTRTSADSVRNFITRFL
ncbi:hypothetical protein DSO57_1023726 [Entomophthora muscae]|uniref:Uncharacterized protein n=1 Tax=Entomophthora muscae TaxID=34485 RepID=A0ACC2UPF1_9FUNG|nr:hypothetical protein DSO57_1023726 [Entomophthora muscae]